MITEAREFIDGWWDSMCENPLATSFVTLVALGLTFGVTECAVGATRHTTGSVLGHEYHPPRTTRSCDDDGCTTTHHPAEYHLVVECSGDVHSFDAGRRAYYRIRDGQVVTVAHRDGRWTGIHYLHWVADESPTAEAW